MARQPAPLGPRRLELARGPDRRPFVRRDDREKTLDADDAHAGQVRDGRFVDRQQRGAERGRTDEAPVQHARNGEVLNVLIASRALGGNVGSQRRLPHLRVSRGRDECGFRVHRQREPAPADERADPDAAATGHGPHFPRDDRQVGDGPLQSLGGKTEERLPSGRRRLTDCRASAREPRAPTCAPCVRTSRRVAVDDADPSRVDAELFGRHLRDGDAHAGPDVHFARVDRDRAVGVDRRKLSTSRGSSGRPSLLSGIAGA